MTTSCAASSATRSATWRWAIPSRACRRPTPPRPFAVWPEKFVNAQFSQANESAADNYSFDLLTERKLERKGLVSAFDKLAKLSGGATGSSLMSSHPPSAERSARMQKRLDAAK
jgi:hypothetical protein